MAVGMVVVEVEVCGGGMTPCPGEGCRLYYCTCWYCRHAFTRFTKTRDLRFLELNWSGYIAKFTIICSVFDVYGYVAGI